MDSATFEKIAQVAADFLTTTATTDAMKNERKMVVAALLDASLAVTGNKLPG